MFNPEILPQVNMETDGPEGAIHMTVDLTGGMGPQVRLPAPQPLQGQGEG